MRRPRWVWSSGARVTSMAPKTPSTPTVARPTQTNFLMSSRTPARTRSVIDRPDDHGQGAADVGTEGGHAHCQHGQDERATSQAERESSGAGVGFGRLRQLPAAPERRGRDDERRHHQRPGKVAVPGESSGHDGAAAVPEGGVDLERAPEGDVADEEPGGGRGQDERWKQRPLVDRPRRRTDAVDTPADRRREQRSGTEDHDQRAADPQPPVREDCDQEGGEGHGHTGQQQEGGGLRPSNPAIRQRVCRQAIGEDLADDEDHRQRTGQIVAEQRIARCRPPARGTRWAPGHRRRRTR